MKRFVGIGMVLVSAVFGAHADMRTWTSTTGQTVEGEYISVIFDSVKLKDAAGKEIKIPLDKLSQADRDYVDIKNPPELAVDYMDKGTSPQQLVADDWIDNGGGAHVNHPVFIMDARFGARVKQTSTKEYNHPLTFEIYVFTKQYYDPDKYHLIAHATSDPFVLSKDKGFKHEWIDKKKHKIIYYNLYSERPRGERLGEYLILVRNEQGDIIDHKGSGNWLFKYYDSLSKLPVGAWMNDKCVRIHPTSPKRDT